MKRNLTIKAFKTWVAIFVCSLILLAILFGGAVCADGWHSSSIGIQGACSHHGGVRHMGFFIFICATLISSVIVFLLYRNQFTIERIKNIIDLFKRLNPIQQFLEFEYRNSNNELIIFKIKPKCIEKLLSPNEYTEYEHFLPEQISLSNFEKLFMQGFDIVRQQNTRFRLTRMENVRIVNNNTNSSSSYQSPHNPFVSTENIDSDKKFLENAIKTHKIISFSYTDRFGKKSNRNFTPERIVMKGPTLCVEGFDHKKNANRIFAIKRMQNIQIF